MSSVLSVMSVQSICGKDKGFHGKDEGFLAKMKNFLFFFVFARNPSSLPIFTLHINEGGTYTEHVQTY